MALHGLANASHLHDNGPCQPTASISASATSRDDAAASSSAPPPPSASGRRPILLLDVMDTIVYDPFFLDMPKHFGITFKELMAAKHPSAWVEYERGLIDEQQLGQKFFADARPCDVVALRQAMVSCYRYLDGMEPLLARLKDAGYEMHAMSNYPAWFKFIEEKLQLSRYLRWTFISCEGPMKGLRKPSLEAYEVAVRTLQVPPAELLFVDDRKGNTDGAAAAGMGAILFEDAGQLESELRARGLEF